MIHLVNIFRRVPADEIRREQLFEAERLQVEHQAAAELHAGLAGIYRLRVERLRSDLSTDHQATLRAIK